MAGTNLVTRKEMAQFNIRRLGVDIEYHTRCIQESTAYLEEVILYEKTNGHIPGVIEGSQQLRTTIEKDIMNHTRLRDKAVGEQQRLLCKYGN